jgi:hypothetical protein
MNFKITAISDSDPDWNEKTELWWNSGGALLWNQFGGAGSEELVLNREDLDEFLSRAAALPGWTAPDASTGGPQGPVRISDDDENETKYNKNETKYNKNETKTEPTPEPGRCCEDCGRPWHPVLQHEAIKPEVVVSVKKLNHVLLALEEAIAFAKGRGPNNYRTWEALMQDFLSDETSDK